MPAKIFNWISAFAAMVYFVLLIVPITLGFVFAATLEFLDALPTISRYPNFLSDLSSPAWLALAPTFWTIIIGVILVGGLMFPVIGALPSKHQRV